MFNKAPENCKSYICADDIKLSKTRNKRTEPVNW